MIGIVLGGRMKIVFFSFMRFLGHDFIARRPAPQSPYNYHWVESSIEMLCPVASKIQEFKSNFSIDNFKYEIIYMQILG